MDMDKLVSLCKRRGFLFQSSEIYGGLNGFWDYGPLGVELKRNIKEAWWQDMVTGHDELAVPAGAPERIRNDRPRLHRSSCTRRSGSARATTTCSATRWSTARSARAASASITYPRASARASRASIPASTTSASSPSRATST